MDRELIARQMRTKEKGDIEVIAALESLKIVAKGQGDEGEVREAEVMVSSPFSNGKGFGDGLME